MIARLFKWTLTSRIKVLSVKEVPSSMGLVISAVETSSAVRCRREQIRPFNTALLRCRRARKR